MRYFLFSLSLLFFLSACSDFSHVRYRKMKLVPANGFVAPLSIHEKENSDKITVSLNDEKPTGKINTTDSVFYTAEVIFSGRKTKDELKPVPKRIDQKAKPVFIAKKKSAPERSISSSKRDGIVVLVILLLLFGLALLVFGGIIFVIGILNVVWWMIALGFIILLLGLFPFVGFFFGTKSHHPEQYQYEENRQNN